MSDRSRLFTARPQVGMGSKQQHGLASGWLHTTPAERAKQTAMLTPCGRDAEQKSNSREEARQLSLSYVPPGASCARASGAAAPPPSQQPVPVERGKLAAKANTGVRPGKKLFLWAVGRPDLAAHGLKKRSL
jgi:hypothetical protein